MGEVWVRCPWGLPLGTYLLTRPEGTVPLGTYFTECAAGDVLRDYLESPVLRVFRARAS